MRIEIAERLKPFSHLPGASSILPGSRYQIQVFPACIKVFDLSTFSSPLILELQFKIKGPVQNFTVQNDLEKGCIRVWAETVFGFYRYSLRSCQNTFGLFFELEKTDQETLSFFSKEKEWHLKAKESRLLLSSESAMSSDFLPGLERLSLGSHKSQDWEMIKRRLDFSEIFPLWYRLGQLIPKVESPSTEGTFLLLHECQVALAQRCAESVMKSYQKLFLAGFKSLLVPTLQDPFYQGILPDKELSSEASALTLLSQGAQLMRQLFIQQEKERIDLLPLLPASFHCGRLVNLEIMQGKFALEWSKKKIRRCEFHTGKEQETAIYLNARHFKQCRIREGKKDQGRMILLCQPLQLKKDHYYFFDNFI